MSDSIDELLEQFEEQRVRDRLERSMKGMGEDADPEAALRNVILSCFTLFGQVFYLAGLVDGREGIPDEFLEERLANIADQLELHSIAALLEMKGET